MNSKEKRNIIKNKQPQIRIDRNEGYSTNYTNYTKSSSHSSNTININKNKNKKLISSNAFNLCRKAKNNFNIYRKSSNPKKNLNIKSENISNLLIDKKDKYKINKSLNLFCHYEETNYKKNSNNIKLIKIDKPEQIKKNSKYFFINNKFLQGLKNINQNRAIKQSKTLYCKYKKDKEFNSIAASIKKYKHKINFSTSKENKINQKIKLKNSDNITLIKVNQKSKSKGKNLTSPNKYKIKQKIKYSNTINNNSKNLIKKRYFESTVITRRFKSPIVIRQCSETQNNKHVNKKYKNKKTAFMTLDKGIVDKIENKTNMEKIKKNPFIIKNIKIKNKLKNIKNKTPLKILTNINPNNHNNQNSSLTKKFKQNAKKNINTKINHKKQINLCYSKENIYYAPNLLYNLNSPREQNIKYIYQDILKNNASINPSIQTLKNKYDKNSNKKIFRRNLNHFNISNTNNTNNANLTNNNHFSNNSISTSLSMNSIAVIADKNKLNNNNMNPFIIDLSCIVFGKKNLEECSEFLVNKFKKYGFIYSKRNLNLFDFYKKQEFYQIEIIQIISEENPYHIQNNGIISYEKENKPVFYLKINQKKGSSKSIKSLSDIIFSHN